MGPSGIYIGYFYIQRMAIWNYSPDIDEVDIFADLARNK
jgi:hypothetical protein